MKCDQTSPIRLFRVLSSLLLIVVSGAAQAQTTAITGELKRWHEVTLTLDGPATSEGATPNPFLDYRMNVTFSNTTSGLTYKVPGYFAADGNAAETSATSGNKWRAHLSPDVTGAWTYTISFRSGANVAVDASATAGSALTPYDGVSGSFNVAETDKTGRDFRGKGRLNYVNKHHLRFADGTYFVKAGADSPENFLAYDDFDNTPDLGGRRKGWTPHVQDWNAGDPVWKTTLGKGIIGAINYISEKGCNAQSFLTLSHNGDDDNVFPWVAAGDPTRFDCSKLDQWEIVFGQGDKMGVYLHFKTQETENDQYLDGGALGNNRKLYYRELIARFGHHLALNWNLGEENSNTDAQRKAFAQFFYDNDPYRHHVVIHTFPGAKGTVYTPLLGTASKYTGASLQSDVGSVYNDTKTWVNNSANAGVPWVVANDEQGSAGTGIDCDSADAAHNNTRKNVLWGNLMAGGAGVEAYYGYQTCESDLTSDDHRTRNNWYSQCAHALKFFNDFGVPFWDMSNQDNLVSGVTGGRCLRKSGESFVIQLPSGGSPSLNLGGAPGNFEVKWFDPRNGGSLQNGSVLNVAGGGTVNLGSAPNNTTQDWIVLVQQAGGVFVNAGPDQMKQFPQLTNQVSLSLSGTVSAGGNPFTATWTQLSGPGLASFANSNAPVTTATITGDPGAYVLQLAATSDTNSASDTLTVTVNAWTPDTTPPVVSITAPANGATIQLGAVLNVTANITDNDAVQSGELFVDGNSQGVDANAPYAWAVNGLSVGAHTLAVRGLDMSGNAATNTISIIVSSTMPNASTITNLAVHDAYIQNSGGTITVVDTSPLRVENNTPTRTRDTYLRFNIADIPVGATINSVTLRVNNQRATTANGTYVVHAGSSAAWVDASPGPNTLADGLITAGAQIGGFVNPAPSSILNIPLTNSFIAGNGSYNLVLKKTTVSVQEAELSTSENATEALRPALIIDMDVTPPDLLPPVVNFIAPTNGQNYPSELPLVAELDVTDDGIVTEVTLDVDGVIVDGLFALPWTFTNSPLSIGAHLITVVAEDATGKRATNAITVQATPLVAPVITILMPTNGAQFFAGAPVTFAAAVTDDVAVTNVTFYADMMPVASFTAPPYSLVLSNLSVGQHNLAVVAADNGGRIASSGVNVGVLFSNTDTNPPSVVINSPTNNASYLVGGDVSVSATVTDNGVLARVVLQVDGSPVATNTAPPFAWNVTGLPTGPHTLRVVGVDAQNNSAFAEVSIEITPDTTPPSVLVTAPANGASFNVGAVINVTATITDNVAVQEARLLVNGAPAGTDVSPPYAFALNNLAAGAYTLAVVGVDTAANLATNAVSITVVSNPPVLGPQIIIGDTFDGTAQTGTAAPLGYLSTAVDVPLEGTLTPSLQNNSAPAGSLSVSVLYAGGLTNNSDFDGSFSFTKQEGVAFDFGPSLAGQRWALTFTAKTTGTTATDKFYIGVSDTNACLVESAFDVAIQMGAGLATNDGQGLKLLANGSAKRNIPNPTTPLSGNVTRTFVLTVDETGALPTYSLTMDGTNVFATPTSFGAFTTASRYVVFNIFDRNPVGGVNVGQIDNVRLEIVAPPFINAQAAVGGLQLVWYPEDWVLEESSDLAGGEWFEVEGATSPHLVATTEPRMFYRTRPAVTVEPPPAGDPLILWATTNFPNINAGQVPAYKDNGRNALAINTVQLPVGDLGKFAAATTTFAGAAGDYNLTLTSLTERDGECTFRVLVNGVQAGQFTNPQIYPSTTEYQEYSVTFSNITVAAGATIRVEFNSDSNELVPEGGGFAYARGRWSKLVFTPNISAPSGVWVSGGGVVVMEAEKTSSSLGNWGFSTTITPGWTGTGHLQFNGNGPSGGNANSPLTYQFKITQTGTYRLYLRARKNLEGAASDLCNDAYVRLAGNYTAGAGGAPLNLLQSNTKFFGGNAGNWGWAAQLDDTSVSPDVKYNALYNFTAGEICTFTMSGRSQRFNVDRIVFRLNGTADATWQNAPESPRAP